MAIRKKIIKVPGNNIYELMRSFNSSKSGVFNALAYRSDSERARNIRKAAIELYNGILTTKIVFRNEK